GGEYICSRGRWSERVAKSVDAAAFEVGGGEQRCGNAFLAVAQYAPGLLSAFDVAREQDHSSRLQSHEQGTEARRHFCAVEADDQQLAHVVLHPGFLQPHAHLRFLSSVPPTNSEPPAASAGSSLQRVASPEPAVRSA